MADRKHSWPADEIEEEIRNPKPKNMLKEVGKIVLAFADDALIIIIILYLGHRLLG
jgi:hypothetical protein